ncbi:MAG: ATP-binding protein, partial [Flavobacterium sp.]|nr:ATP-binding protein [Flavobacterium sp.]
MENFITVAIFNYQHETLIIKNLLEQEGIAYFFENETIVGIDPFATIAYGGIKLKVNEQQGSLDVDLAAQQTVIKADRLHLTNILHNLLDNAMKYCKDIPHLTVRTETKGKQLCLTIADKGIGIPKEVRDKIFTPFFTTKP